MKNPRLWIRKKKIGIKYFREENFKEFYSLSSLHKRDSS